MSHQNSIQKQTWNQHQNITHTALALAEYAESYNGPLVVITPDASTADTLEKACRFFLKNDFSVTLFPDWEILPYDAFSPHQDIISDRLSILYHLSNMEKGIVLIAITTLMHPLPPPVFLDATTFLLKIGEKIEFTLFRERLVQAGYRSVEQVYEHGEFGTRGSIFDVFPMGSDVPYRIDREGDIIESIRIFDPETQCSTGKTHEIRLLPAKEFPLNAAGIQLFKEQWTTVFADKPTRSTVYQAVTKGFAPVGIEYYLPLFFKKTAIFFDYVPKQTIFLYFDSLEASSNSFLTEVKTRYQELKHDQIRPILAPSTLFLSTPSLFEHLHRFHHIEIKTQSASMPLITHKNIRSPVETLTTYRKQHPEERILLLAESLGRRERILNLLKPHEIEPKIIGGWKEFQQSKETLAISIAPLEIGFSIPGVMAIISETEWLGEPHRPTHTKSPSISTTLDQSIRHFAELAIGDPIVHTEHGIGRYLGLQNLSIDNQMQEFLMLEYAGGDKLYVPVHALYCINRYAGSKLDTVTLHKLGSDKWQRDKTKAEKKIHDVAAELLELYANRALQKRPPFKIAYDDYETFVERFLFEETPDQQKAIDAVIHDLQDEKPMDRLICGDVGFGKTEVALRAAFIAIHNGKQVAILVPTTLLAQQHHQTFLDRFANWPVTIEVFSRLKTNKAQQDIVHGLETGKIDIVIGTHKLIHRALPFKALGLLIIDEEHRFGVEQKEKLKALRGQVDILTLTATPIPRTLHMAMAGVREFSLITTPPKKRLSIKTFVREYQKGLIREAILRELHRGGQIYYLHNDIKTIEATAKKLRDLVPEAQLKIGHGQMHKHDLERVMVDFYHQRFHILVCTTIIETGLDVPTANTMIIEHADQFGLAQLYQIRGRVGRSHHQAYAYLFIPPNKRLDGDAKKRLEAISTYEELGSGFMLASHDLEIRGAGELLGAEQSGQVDAVGYSLYMELLEEAIHTLQHKTPTKQKPMAVTEMNLHIPALFPDSYIADVHTRLLLYKRIASATDNQTLEALQVELIDRFGLLPEPAKNLLAIQQLRLVTTPLGILKITLGGQGGTLEFSKNTSIPPEKLIQLLQKNPKTLKLEGYRLKIQTSFQNSAEKLKFLETFLSELPTICYTKI